MLKRAIMGALMLALSAPAAAADGWNWHSEKDRQQLDQVLRKIGEQCSQLGFTRLTPPEPATMEKRIYSRLLLESPQAAGETVEKWSRWFMTFVNLEKSAKAATDRLASAVVAASVDPTSHERARATFVDAFAFPFHPVVATCAEASRDEFVGATYVSGAGSVDSIRQRAKTLFDKEVADYNRGTNFPAQAAGK